MLSKHHAKYGVHRPCKVEIYRFYLSRDHLVDGSRDFVDGAPLS